MLRKRHASEGEEVSQKSRDSTGDQRESSRSRERFQMETAMRTKAPQQEKLVFKELQRGAIRQWERDGHTRRGKRAGRPPYHSVKEEQGSRVSFAPIPHVF